MEKARVGVGYKSLTGSETAFVRPDARFSTASVFKIFVLVDFFRRCLERNLDPDTRVPLKDADRSPGSGVLQYLGEGAALRLRDYGRLMMIISDNTAADVLFDYLGPDSVADTVSWLGLENTVVKSGCKDILTYEQGTAEVKRKLGLLGLDSRRLDRQEALALLRKNIHRLSGVRPLKELEASLSDEERKAPSNKFCEDDLTSPRDLITTLERVYSERVLGKFTGEFLDIMAMCETGLNRIRRGIPRDAMLAHKTGTVRGVVNDAGIVIRGREAYALVVLVNGIQAGASGGCVRKGEKIIADISAMAWKAEKARS
ncbi:MAG: serine hydrolase [Nitrososphaerota archaeon]|nr:serine hydrolase [Nitrososphaerota archaeon]